MIPHAELEGINLSKARARVKRRLAFAEAGLAEMHGKAETYQIESKEDEIVFFRRLLAALATDETWLRYCLMRAVSLRLMASPVVDEPYSLPRLRAAYALEIRSARSCYAGWQRDKFTDEQRAASFALARRVRLWCREQLFKETKET